MGGRERLKDQNGSMPSESVIMSASGSSVLPAVIVHHEHQQEPSGCRPGSNPPSKTSPSLFIHPNNFNRVCMLRNKAALENSFSSVSSIPTAGSDEAEAPAVSTTSGTTIATPPPTSEPQPVSDASNVPVPGDAHDGWKTEYESNLAKWKHENAVQREKAEKVRTEWEAKRSSIGPTPIIGASAGQKDHELGEHLAKIQRSATAELGTGWEEVSEADSPAVISANITPVSLHLASSTL